MDSNRFLGESEIPGISTVACWGTEEGKSWFSLIPSPSKPSKTASWHLKQLANRKRTRELHHDALFDTSISVCTFGVLQYQILTTVDKQTQNSMVPKLPHFPDLYPITGACWLLASG